MNLAEWEDYDRSIKAIEGVERLRKENGDGHKLLCLGVMVAIESGRIVPEDVEYALSLASQ